MIREREQQNLLVRLVTLKMGAVPVGLLSIVALLAALAISVTSIPKYFNCSPAAVDPSEHGLTWAVTQNTSDYLKIEVFDGMRSVAYADAEIFTMRDNAALSLEVALRLAGLKQLNNTDLISFGTVKVTALEWRNHNIGRFLILKLLELLKEKGVKYFWSLNKANDWTYGAPDDFNPWIKPYSSCYPERAITQLRPNDPWKEVLIRLR